MANSDGYELGIPNYAIKTKIPRLVWESGGYNPILHYIIWHFILYI